MTTEVLKGATRWKSFLQTCRTFLYTFCSRSNLRKSQIFRQKCSETDVGDEGAAGCLQVLPLAPVRVALVHLARPPVVAVSRPPQVSLPFSWGWVVHHRLPLLPCVCLCTPVDCCSVFGCFPCHTCCRTRPTYCMPPCARAHMQVTMCV